MNRRPCSLWATLAKWTLPAVIALELAAILIPLGKCHGVLVGLLGPERTEDVFRAMSDVGIYSFVVGGIAIFGTILAQLLIARKITNPLSKMTKTTYGVSGTTTYASLPMLTRQGRVPSA